MYKFCFTLLCIVLLSAGMVTAQDRTDLSIPQMLAKFPAIKNDTARLNLLLLIADSYIMKPGEDNKDLDTALLLVGQVQKASLRDPHRTAICYLLTSKALREKRYLDSARKYSRLAVDILGKEELSADYAYACVELAHTYDIQNLHEDSLRIGWYYKAIPIFESTGRKFELASTWEILGNCIGHLKPAEGIPPLLRALEIYRSLPGDHDLRALYNLLAGTYDRSGDPVHAITYGLEAIRTEERLHKMDAATVSSYNRIALIYHNQGDLQNAISSVRKARDLSFRLDTADTHMLTYSLVRFLLEDHQNDSARQALQQTVEARPTNNVYERIFVNCNFCEYYLNTGHVDSARPYAENLVNLSGGLDLHNGIQKAPFSALMDYGIAARQYDMVRKYGHDMLLYSQHRGDRISAYTAYRQLSRADSSLGDYRTAMVEYQSYVNIRDSIRAVDNAKQVASLNLQYETEKKNKDIQSLTHKQQLDAAALRQAGLIRNFTIGGLALLLILLLVSFNRYRLKQRSNRQLNVLLAEKEDLLTEKEWLLKEIHHRVKNNLQIGISLLNLQSYHIENEKAQSAIRQSRNRMYAMSLIHQRLYQTDNLKTIDMRQYISQLVESIDDSYAGEKDIDFELAIQPLELNVEHALPIGLIINETITNSLKYAFPHRQKGRIVVVLDTSSGYLNLTIADNGIGLPPSFDIRQHVSMGTQLIDILVQQLDGHLEIINQDGLSISIRIPLPSATLHYS